MPRPVAWHRVTLVLVALAGSAVASLQPALGQYRADRLVSFASDRFSSAQAVAVGPNSSVYVAGDFTGRLVIGGDTLWSPSANCAFVARLDPDLQLMWARRIPATGISAASAIASDGTAGVLVGGYFTGSLLVNSHGFVSRGDSDAFVARIDSAGDLQWATTFGGREADGIMAVAVHAGEVTAAGFMSDTVELGAAQHVSRGTSDALLVGLDAAGIVRWSRTYGGELDDRVHGLAADVHGGFYACGYFRTLAVFQSDTLRQRHMIASQFLMRCTPAGELRWVRQLDTLWTGGIAYGVAADSGGAYMTGFFWGTLVLDTIRLPGSGREVFVSKCDTSGRFLWHFRAGADVGRNICTTDICTTDDGSILAVGSFSTNVSGGPVAVDFGKDTIRPDPGREFDMFLVALDAWGTEFAVAVGGGTFSDYSLGVAAGANGVAYVVGRCNPPISLDGQQLPPGPTRFHFDGFVARYVRQASSVPPSVRMANKLEIRPNPVAGTGMVQATLTSEAAGPVSVRVLDLLGVCVYRGQHDGGGGVLHLSIPRPRAGWYVIEAEAMGRLWRARFVVQ